jgi:hypothetical protein
MKHGSDAPLTSLTNPDVLEIVALVEQIRPLLAGREPDIVGGALADLLATWLAGFRVLDNPKATTEFREAMLQMHLECMRPLIAINEKEQDARRSHTRRRAD